MPLSCAFDAGTYKSVVKTHPVSRVERTSSRQPHFTPYLWKDEHTNHSQSKQVCDEELDNKRIDRFVASGLPSSSSKNSILSIWVFSQSSACCRSQLSRIRPECAPDARKQTWFHASSSQGLGHGWRGKRTESKGGFFFV